MNIIKTFSSSRIFKTALIWAALLGSGQVIAQRNSDWWTILPEKPHNLKSTEINPISGKSVRWFQLNLSAFHHQLSVSEEGKEVIVHFPGEKGESDYFKVSKVSVMSETMEKRFPEIASFQGIGVTNPLNCVRLTVSPFGIHAILDVGQKQFELESLPDQPSVFYMTDISGPYENNPQENSPVIPEGLKNASLGPNDLPFRSDTILRTYRLVLACTGEFSQAIIKNKGIPPSAINTIKKLAVLTHLNELVSELNEVYKRELSVTFELVPNTWDVIFLNPKTDSLTNNNKDTLINEIPAIMNRLVPLEDYDLGHVLSAQAFGGLAGGSICSPSKMRGVSHGFSLVTIVHEIGHMMGAGHPFNCYQCGDGKPGAFPDGSVSVELECGNTIMAYGGVEEMRFHCLNTAQIYSRIINAPCGKKTKIANPPPSIEAGLDYIIPKSTPFILHGKASDINDTALTYSWEEIDPEPVQDYFSHNRKGPMSQCVVQSRLPIRYMPDIQTVLKGELKSGRVNIPSVGREMNFALIVRDNNPLGGQVAIDKMKVTVDESSGPFRCISQQRIEKWTAGESVSIVWDVARTNMPPVNTSQVNIMLSRDGGLSFTDTLKWNTPNDGVEMVNIPDIATTKGRIKIESAGNIFYTVNLADITIGKSNTTLVFQSTHMEVCIPDTARFEFTYFEKSSTGMPTFEVTGLPAGASSDFKSVSPITSGTPVRFNVFGLDTTMIGSHTLTIQVKVASGIIHQTGLTLKVYSADIKPVVLNGPGSKTDSLDFPVLFRWKLHPNVSKYSLELAYDSLFQQGVYFNDNLRDSSLILDQLAGKRTYFWRMIGENLCGKGPYSEVFSFQTRDSLIFVPDDNFEKALIAYRFDNLLDDSVRFANISQLLHLRIPEKKIQDLTGIESFVSLNWLKCPENKLEFLDVSNNMKLKSLQCGSNELSRIELKSVLLESFNALGNKPLTCVLVDDSVYYKNKFPAAIPSSAIYTKMCAKDSTSKPSVKVALKSVFPNPTGGKIYVTGISEEVKTTLSVYSLLGTLLRKIDTSNQLPEIDLGGLNPGVYILVIDNGPRQVFKVFKQ